MASPVGHEDRLAIFPKLAEGVQQVLDNAAEFDNVLNTVYSLMYAFLFSLPIVLLGTVTPWAVRLTVQDVEHAGQVAGRLSALATAGSILGTFLPVLWLIPAYGTRWTFYILAMLLLVVVGGGGRGRERMGPWRGRR